MLNFIKIVLYTSFLLGCEKYIEHRGKSLEENDLKVLIPNKSTKQDVAKTLGKSTLDFNNGKRKLYIGQTLERQSFLEPKMLQINVYIADFDKNGKLISIKKKTPTPNDIKLCKVETSIHEEDIPFWRQLFLNYKKMGERLSNMGKD